MSANPGHSADSKPAVYNERTTGVASSDDGRISAVQTAIESRSVLDQLEQGGQASDTNLNAATQGNTLQNDTPIRIGRVLLALPYIHCYKIQLDGRQGTCIATATSTHSHSPLGVRRGDVIPVNSQVLIWKPQAAKLSYILGVLPSPTTHDGFNLSDHIQQGGNSGPKKVEAYRNMLKSTPDAMGFVAQSAGRPMDGTTGEYVRMSETGIGILIDSFQAYLRVNEVCGLWLNYFDNYAKLAGLSLDIMSYCEHNKQIYDEGELFSMRGYTTYPWEATGMYASKEKFSKTNSKEAVQLDREHPFAEEDLEDFDQTPIYRLTEHTGYLGQGFNRTLMKPAKEDGKRRMSDDDKDTGLFQELLSLDGGYSVRSAKQITIAKYPLIPIPRRKRAVEDALGDDLLEENKYRFSGEFGSGDEHKVKEWKDSSVTELSSLMRPAGVLDMLAHHYNWKSVHPFEYHKKDYEFYEENEGPELSEIKFLRGDKFRTYVEVYPATQLKIDDRYGNVNYYNTASFFSLTEDGSVVIGDGYGSQILMTGGQIRLEAGGDVMLMSGSRVVTLADEAIIRANGSVDISSNNLDVRIKAEKNMQLLAGNSGSGGMLLESKGQGLGQAYKDELGEHVFGSGIVCLSRGGSFNVMTKTIYLRSGVDEGNAESTGQIVIDAANGRSDVTSYASSHGFFNSNGLGIWHSPVGQDEVSIDKSHFFGPTFAKVNGPCTITKHVGIVEGGSLGVDGHVMATQSVIALSIMAAYKAIVGDSQTNNIPEIVYNFIDVMTEAGEKLTENGEKYFEAYYPEGIWEEMLPGNTALLEDQIGFSFRDRTSKGGGTFVYGYAKDQFFLLETRWQQLQRLGMVSGNGATWEEQPVEYQGEELWPWPGKKHWIEDDTFLQYENDGNFLLFDTGGYAKKREDAEYEEPEFQDWKRNTPDNTYKL